mmetsp:Transcript_21749/g.28122  ORF Transcript_21749/g.28122 Transcript_21749/m.28122 type:complete len:142 (+) Transcript_21749:135-560(+)
MTSFVESSKPNTPRAVKRSRSSQYIDKQVNVATLVSYNERTKVTSSDNLVADSSRFSSGSSGLKRFKAGINTVSSDSISLNKTGRAPEEFKGNFAWNTSASDKDDICLKNTLNSGIFLEAAQNDFDLREPIDAESMDQLFD